MRLPCFGPRPAQVRLFYMLPVQGVNKEIVEISTHTGTNCDAPFHFFESGETIEQVPLDTYVGWATILDLRGMSAGSVIRRDDVERTGELVEQGDVVLLNTGWGRKRANTEELSSTPISTARPHNIWSTATSRASTSMRSAWAATATRPKPAPPTALCWATASLSSRSCTIPTRSWMVEGASSWRRL